LLAFFVLSKYFLTDSNSLLNQQLMLTTEQTVCEPHISNSDFKHESSWKKKFHTLK